MLLYKLDDPNYVPTEEDIPELERLLTLSKLESYPDDFDPERVKEYNNIPEEDLREFYNEHREYPPTDAIEVRVNGWIDKDGLNLI